MTLPSCRGSGKSAKKLRKTKASLRAPRLEEGSCNVIATLRHDQSATDRITPNQATGRLGVGRESPCRIIPDRSITFLHANHYDDSELQPFVTNSFARLPCRHTEEALRLHQQSLARLLRFGSIGELAAAVAHELNQPLMAAGTYARLVEDAIRSDDADAKTVAGTASKVATQVERAAEVVRRLRALVQFD